MGLTTRLNAFFLAALALVLLGFSTTLQVLSRRHLHRQVDERLEVGLAMLSAAAEPEPMGIEWEPSRRPPALGSESDLAEVRWTVQDERGTLVEHSTNLNPQSVLLTLTVPEHGSKPRFLRVVSPHNQHAWRVLQTRIDAVGPPQVGYHKSLTLTVGLRLAPIEESLRNLARTTTALSITIWLAAAATGRALCRRALAPMTRMAAAARKMRAEDLDQRLPDPGTGGDELSKLGEAFNGLLARLREAFERQRRFTGDASHQLRTPLAAMLGQIDVTLRRQRSNDEYRHALALVRDQAEQLNRIVEMLLFLARADAEAKLPNLETIDLAAWVRIRLDAWNDHPRRDDLVVRAADVPVFVRAHPPLLGQLLDNLIENALKYCEPGSAVTIDVARQPDGQAVLAVEDAGPGIDPEDIDHLFEPFFRSPKVRRAGHDGFGLGLAVAHRIAVAFGGNLEASNIPDGHGARFTLTLPPEPQKFGLVDNPADLDALAAHPS